MRTTKRRCRLLRRRGYSIGEIARTLTRSESTVHWHIKDIQLTQAQRERIHARWRTVMVQVNARRRGRALKPTMFRTPRWSGNLVHLVAHLSFDGRVDRFGGYYYNRSYRQALHVKKLFRHLLGLTPRMKLRRHGIWVVSYCNVEVASWLSEKERQLLGAVHLHGEWRRQWLKAFFDDEGHIHIAKHIRRVRASQDDPQVLRNAQQFLRTLGIQGRMDTHARALEITGRENLRTFRKRINFSSGIYINAHRKNGLWRRPIEKRKLLDIALASYEVRPLFHNLGR